MLVLLGCGVCEIPAFGNTCPSKTFESYSWVLLEAGKEGGALMWWFLGGEVFCFGLVFLRWGVAGLWGIKTRFYFFLFNLAF